MTCLPLFLHRDQLKQRYNTGQYWIEVAMEDISSFDELLADKLNKMPTEHLPLVSTQSGETACATYCSPKSIYSFVNKIGYCTYCSK